MQHVVTNGLTTEADLVFSPWHEITTAGRENRQPGSGLATRFYKDNQEPECGFEELSKLRSHGVTLVDALQQHIDSGLITSESDFVSLTTEGLLIADIVIADFL